MERHWSFRSAGGVSQDRNGPERFVRGLEQALRVAPRGHGVLRLSLETGPKGRLILSADGPELVDWARGAILPAYPVNRWRETREGPATGPLERIGRAFPDPAGPFPSLQDGALAWLDLVLGQTPCLPAGFTLELAMEPGGYGATGRGRPGGPLVPQPPGFRVPASPLAARTIADRLEERRLGAVWALRVRLLRRESPGFDPSDAAARLADLIASASHRDGGSGIELRAAGRWRSRTVPAILLSASELSMVFPGVTALFLPLPLAGVEDNRPLTLGPGPSGRVARLWMARDEGRHLLILGETGMGKSTLLVRLAARVSRDAGLVLLDPVGDTGRRFLDGLPRSGNPPIWVSPVRSPVRINALAPTRGEAVGGAVAIDRAIDDLVNALRRVRSQRFGETPFWGPRIEETARGALRVARALPGGTLVEAERLLDRPGPRPHGIPEGVRAAYEALRERALERPDEVEGARRLLGEIADHPLLRSMLCDPEARTTIDRWIAPGQVTVITGDASEIGEAAARYLLAVYLALLWPALCARPDRSKVVVALEEAQAYAHESAAEMLRLGRKTNVHVWLATQSLASLSDPLAEACRTNAADLVLFRGAPSEARELHRWVPSVTEEMLLSLGRGEALVLSGKGEELQWLHLGWARRDPGEGPGSVPAGLTDVPPNRAAPAGPSSADAARDPAESDPGVLRIVRTLATEALAQPGLRELVVPLARLRHLVGDDERAIRSLGAELGREGLLIRSRDGPEGRQWVLDAERLRREILPVDRARPGAEPRSNDPSEGP